MWTRCSECGDIVSTYKIKNEKGEVLFHMYSHCDWTQQAIFTELFDNYQQAKDHFAKLDEDKQKEMDELVDNLLRCD